MISCIFIVSRVNGELGESKDAVVILDTRAWLATRVRTLLMEKLVTKEGVVVQGKVVHLEKTERGYALSYFAYLYSRIVCKHGIYYVNVQPKLNGPWMVTMVTSLLPGTGASLVVALRLGT
jgi:hypothetical protein